jgi:hypothetical protein
MKHGLSNHPLHQVWLQMKARCLNDKHKSYTHYGGRGISIYEKWLDDFKAYFDYVANLPGFGDSNLSLDRIDNDGNYEPGNLRWATKSQQRINSGSRRSKSGYIGVEFNRRRQVAKWKASITVDGKRISLGHHMTAKDAVIRRNNYILTMGLDDYPIQDL